jgi:signal transduction histidine kinase
MAQSPAPKTPRYFFTFGISRNSALLVFLAIISLIAVIAILLFLGQGVRTENESVLLTIKTIESNERPFGQVSRAALLLLSELNGSAPNIILLAGQAERLSDNGRLIGRENIITVYPPEFQDRARRLSNDIQTVTAPKITRYLLDVTNQATRSEIIQELNIIEITANNFITEIEMFRIGLASDLQTRISQTSDQVRRVFFVLLFAVILNGVFGFSALIGVARAAGQTEIAKQALARSNLELEDRIVERTRDFERAAYEAEKLARVRTQFLASISHEIRTPLNAILNYSQIVSSGMFGEINPQQADALNKVTQSGHHLLGLVNDALDMSKIESGQMKLFIEPNIDLKTELQLVIDTAHSLLKDKPAVTFSAEIAEDLPKINGDRRRIRQIFLNLVSNACKFTNSGSITLTLEVEGEQIIGSVKDTGPGIAPEEQKQIFEMFRQASAGREKGEGTGLGLPISRYFAEMHNGRLWVESRVGQGATFKVAFPIVEADTENVGIKATESIWIKRD